MPMKKLVIAVTTREREAILQHVALPANVAARLRFAVHAKGSLEFELAGREIVDFTQALDQAFPLIKERGDARAVGEVFERLAVLLSEEALAITGGLSLPPGAPPEVREAFEELLEATDVLRALQTMDSLEGEADAGSDEPLEALLGLTANQTLRLMEDDWTNSNSPLHFGAPTRAELAGSKYCMGALRFLALAEETKGFKLTEKKNLNRASVKQLLDGGCWP